MSTESIDDRYETTEVEKVRDDRDERKNDER